MNLFRVILLVFIIIISSSGIERSTEQQWKDFKAKYKKTYRSQEEESMRYENFEKNLDFFYEVNMNENFTIGVNRDADMSEKEIQKRLDMETNFFYYIKMMLITKIIYPQFPHLNDSDIPESIDWREKNAVPKVEDQMMDDCGSCYAFAAVGALESRYFIKTGKLLSLSKQEIVDCSFGNNGCGSGSGLMTYTYVIENGIALEKDYKYEAKEGECKIDVPRSEAKVYGYVQLEGEENLKKAVAQGPVKVLMNARLRSLNFYRKGIYDDPNCKSSTNHAALVVGYGRSDEGIDYWIVKNSWSEDWGEDGYIRIAMNQKVCGIGNQFFYPLLNESDQDSNEFNYVLLKTLGFLVAVFMIVCCVCCCCFFLCRRCCRQKRSYQC